MPTGRIPYQPQLDSMLPTVAAPAAEQVGHDWRSGLPSLTGALVTLRDVRLTDAPSLFTALASHQVSGFISPPPASAEGFEKFIAWTQRMRGAGQNISFAVTPRGSDTAIGLYQVRSLDPGFATAEWGFAIASEFWGTGVFFDGAQLLLDFVFDVVGVYRLEARASVRNGRGNGALEKLGAVNEGVLRRSLFRNGEHLDQVLWTILADDRREARAVLSGRVIH